MGKMNASDKIIFENQKKEKIWKQRNFCLHKSISKRSFRHRIHSFL